MTITKYYCADCAIIQLYLVILSYLTLKLLYTRVKFCASDVRQMKCINMLVNTFMKYRVTMKNQYRDNIFL